MADEEARRKKMFEIIGIIAVAITVVGVYLNIYKIRFCFYLWLVGNTLFMGMHWYLGSPSLVGMDVIFIALAVYGLYKWKRKD